MNKNNLVAKLYYRRAAPRKKRPKQYCVQLRNRKFVDVTEDVWNSLEAEAMRRGGMLDALRYWGYDRLPGDKIGDAKWFCWKIAIDLELPEGVLNE